MEIIASQFIGYKTSKDSGKTFCAVNPQTGEELDPAFVCASESEVDRAIKRAIKIFPDYREIPAEQRAEFLTRIAEEIEALGSTLIERCMQETGLPQARLEGERGRTCNQLRMFADLVREGSWVDARIDLAQPEREPIPKPDLRRMMLPLGPVVVFGASNFPLAFSTAGGDTASALAAGNPVIVKAHPAHPGTSELVARAISKAGISTGMPDGVFSMVQGLKDVGAWLVQHSGIEAVAFTGSLAGGRSLYDLASKRPKPIPVFAEMGSLNPVFVLDGAIQERGEQIADGLVASVTLGCGQFCTNPGVFMGFAGDTFRDFVKLCAKKMRDCGSGAMLTQSIDSSYKDKVKGLREHEKIQLEGEAREVQERNVGGVIFSTDSESFMKHEVFTEEVFGPSTLAVFCNSPEDMGGVIRSLPGQLTGSIHYAKSDLPKVERLKKHLETKVGRLVLNGFPTGVEVCPSMHHGGPYPATTDSRFTSVGTAAIQRFVRPICYQDLPDELLPPELKNSNPLGIWRLIDGTLSNQKV